VMRCNQPHLRKAACNVGHAAQDALLTNTLTLTSEMARSLTASGVSAKNSSRNLHARQPGGRYSVRWEASAGMVRCGWELVSACWMNSGLTTWQYSRNAVDRLATPIATRPARSFVTKVVECKFDDGRLTCYVVSRTYLRGN
jgi:hypothetical protein